MKDLAHYEAIIKSYINTQLRYPKEEVPLLSQTLQIIHNLFEVCIKKKKKRIQGN